MKNLRKFESPKIVMFWRIVLLQILLLNLGMVHASKMYSGQRVFSDVHMIRMIDPMKHGFHIVLDDHFVDTHLQPIRLPTVFVTAIALSPKSRQHKNYTTPLQNGQFTPRSTSAGRVTKVLYPENGSPDDGLLDGRTIKLMGLEESSWYYVCVEFESNLNRHELATGLTCALKRTLDKFGADVASISDVQPHTVTHNSISATLRVEANFPLKLYVYLSQDAENEKKPTRTVPAQTYILRHGGSVLVDFGPDLEPETSYGRLCVMEEPLLSSVDTYTAMGRYVSTVLEKCYFSDLKTKAAPLVHLHVHEQQQRQQNLKMSDEAPRKKVLALPSSEANQNRNGVQMAIFQFLASVFFYYLNFPC